MKHVNVSDHAVVRWLERCQGIDLTFARKEIAEIVQAAVNLGAANYSLAGVTYILDGPTVTTIVAVKSGAAFRKNAAKLNGRSQRVQR